MQKNFILFFIIFISSCSSTNVSVNNTLHSKGKSVGIGGIKISAQKKTKPNTDTVCICTAQSTEQALIPYLQKAGFTVINLAINDRTNSREIMRIADSAKVDYILTGIGLVDIVGKTKTAFMEQLTIQIQDMKTGEIAASASFSGVSIRPVKAAAKIGEQLIKKLK